MAGRVPGPATGYREGPDFYADTLMKGRARRVAGGESSVLEEYSGPELPLLICFASIGGKLPTPPFEFQGVARPHRTNKLFLRDLHRSWYHAGLADVTSGIEETAAFLREKVRETGASRVITMGNSMGGYAALLFGKLIDAAVIHAFSPQTVLHDERYIRNKERIAAVHERYPATFFDLKPVMEKPGEGLVHIYYDMTNSIDRKHAGRLKKVDGARFYRFIGGGHGLVRFMRETGQLARILHASCHEPLTRLGDQPLVPRLQFTEVRYFTSWLVRKAAGEI
ncbi:MAG: hypothetical protein Kow0089_15780 [Desulfobulbaceae bacterium]